MEKDTELLEKEVKTPAETDGDFKEDTSPKKTAMQELKDKIALLQKFSLAWTIISMNRAFAEVFACLDDNFHDYQHGVFDILRFR